MSESKALSNNEQFEPNPSMSIEFVMRHIDSLKAEFSDLDSNVYRSLHLDGRLSSIDVLSLQRSMSIVDVAAGEFSNNAITDEVKVTVVTMLLLDIKLEYRYFALLLPRLVNLKAPDVGYRRAFVRFFEFVERAIAQEKKQASLGTSSETKPNQLDIYIREQVDHYLAPLNKVIHLILTDYAFMSSASGVAKKAHDKDRLRYLKVTRISRERHYDRFKSAISESWDKVAELNESLIEVKMQKKSQIMALKKEIKKLREKLLQSSSSDPMSDLLGIDVEANKDLEIAELTKKLDILEARNNDLQRENIRLNRKLNTVHLEKSEKK